MGLLWHSLSSDNLGLVAITEGQIAALRRAASRAGVGVEITVFGNVGSRRPSPGFEGIEEIAPPSLRYLVLRGTRFARRLAACDLVLDVGEGDGFSDVYGGPRLLALVLPRLRLVRSAGRVFAMAPQTLGPFATRAGRWLGTRGAARADRIFCRDSASCDSCAELVPAAPCSLATDLALGAPPAQASSRAHGAPLRVGLNVSALLWRRGYTGEDEFALRTDYRALVTGLLEAWCGRGDAEVHLIAHVVRGDASAEDDYGVAGELAEGRSRAILAPRFECPDDVRSYLAGLDYVCSARLHCAIAAFTQTVATTTLAYSPKAAALFGDLGYDRVVDLRSVATGDARAAVLRDFEERAALAPKVASGLARARAKLAAYEDALVELLAQARPR